jgi:hypothetical protein
LEDEPVFSPDTGKVCNSSGKEFYIVHQYDRVPEWKKFVSEKYKQDDESLFFKYKV